MSNSTAKRRLSLFSSVCVCVCVRVCVCACVRACAFVCDCAFSFMNYICTDALGTALSLATPALLLVTTLALSLAILSLSSTLLCTRHKHIYILKTLHSFCLWSRISVSFAFFELIHIIWDGS